MGGKFQKREGENIRKQLAVTVRSIQWSYGIFWSPSSTEPGVLEWGEGYYNGDIKTRKTILSTELNDSGYIGSQRSDQLRELYESLLSGHSNLQARRPSAALSPEDLTNAEWYYLVCMSFVFSIGQGLPGRSLANYKPVWLCNADSADTGVFARSLLAKSAGIKTVMCFPHSSGVIELGVTESVREDLDLIQHVRTTYLEVSGPNTFVEFSSDVQPPKDKFLVDRLNGDASHSQAQSWHLIDDDELSNYVHTSDTSSDCISETFVNPEDAPPSSKTEATIDTNDLLGIQGIGERSLSEDMHYQNVLSSLFTKSHPLILGSSFHNLDRKSSFISWKKKGSIKVDDLRKGSPQKMLKRILFEVPQMHISHSLGPTQLGDEANTNHMLAERRRREKVNERFSVLKSLIPSMTKADKISVLDETIEYLKDLERRVEELESSHESGRCERKNKRRLQDMEERTSDNYKTDINAGYRNKRKAREIDEGGQDCNLLSAKSISMDNVVTVHMVEGNIHIDIRSPWRESLLIEIIDALSILRLDSHSVQSSTSDGILCLTMKSKLRESTSSSIGMITQTLQRVLFRNC